MVIHFLVNRKNEMTGRQMLLFSQERSYRIVLIILFSFIIFGCGSYKMFKTPAELDPLSTDERVFFEPDAKYKAELISSLLDNQIKKIEETHYGSFKQPIRIYVFSRQNSFSKYAIQAKAGGETYGNKILISPKKENTVNRIPGVVLHELSHFHLFGYLGLYKSRITPRWFIEGLAVWVSNGVGAEKSSKEDAIAQIIEGNHINPVTRHPLFFGETSHPPGMKTHMFYRQSALFVEYLIRLNENRFRELIQGVERGESFGIVFENAYGSTPKNVWDQFSEELKHIKLSQ